jgi:hypothetical protein
VVVEQQENVFLSIKEFIIASVLVFLLLNAGISAPIRNDLTFIYLMAIFASPRTQEKIGDEGKKFLTSKEKISIL